MSRREVKFFVDYDDYDAELVIDDGQYESRVYLPSRVQWQLAERQVRTADLIADVFKAGLRLIGE